MLDEHRKPHSKVMVDLLRDGLVEQSHPEWEKLRIHEDEIRRHLAPMGLDVVVREDFNYAFVYQMTAEDGSTLGLMRRYDLAFEVSVLAILLFERFSRFWDQEDSLDQTHCFIDRSDLREDFELRVPGLAAGLSTNEVKREKDFDKFLLQLQVHHFLKKTEIPTRFIIHPFVRERVTDDVLQAFKSQFDDIESV